MVELYGCWDQANSILTWIMSSLSAALFQIPRLSPGRLCGNLSVTLVRANARALLARCAGCKDGPGDDFLE